MSVKILAQNTDKRHFSAFVTLILLNKKHANLARVLPGKSGKAQGKNTKSKNTSAKSGNSSVICLITKSSGKKRRDFFMLFVGGSALRNFY